jgi:hypothetical protein
MNIYIYISLADNANTYARRWHTYKIQNDVDFVLGFHFRLLDFSLAFHSRRALRVPPA